MADESLKYQDYLDRWDERFSDDGPQACYYYRWGRRVDCTLRKLNESEFNHHAQGLAEAERKYEAARQVNDGDGMDAALAQSFPHELILLF